ncbi:MAG: aspartate aminotransferase family protein [Phycisphaerales bacterium]|nr:aspartate aminotransferase family protein [Phycisphaerales bacterium]
MADLPVLPVSDHQPRPYDGPSRADVLEMRREFLTPALVTYYADPVMIVEGHMQWLFDETGKRYLDGIAGIVTVSVGHCHPKVLDAVREQNERLQHTTTIYLNPNIAEFGKKLISTFPDDSGLGVCYFTNSGSEANELAMLMARLHTGNFDILALRNAYHGLSNQAMGLTALHSWKYPYPQGFGVKHVKCPDRYRGPFGYDDPEAGAKYAADVEDVLKYASTGQVAGFIAEPIQGVGGTVELPDGYLSCVYELVRSHGGICISDEVQTGFGRTGTAFWGFENHGVKPDIVTMAKGIGNGAPLGCCVARSDVAECMSQRLHFNTYGGNPVSMAQGLSTLDVLLEDNVQQHALDVGGYLKQGLEDLQSRHTIVGDVRGQGLMLGVELVTDRQAKTPATTETAAVHERAKDLGLLIGKGGLYGNVLRIKPPMCIQREDCDFLCQVLDVCLNEVG